MLQLVKCSLMAHTHHQHMYTKRNKLLSRSCRGCCRDHLRKQLYMQLPTGGQVIQFSHLPCLFTFSVTQLLLQPISLVKVKRGRVTSSEASPKTIHWRCVEMSTVRAVGSLSVLLQEEVHALNKEEIWKRFIRSLSGVDRCSLSL